MTCEDCLHQKVCVDWCRGFEEEAKLCEHFKNKSNVIDLPCKMGDTVYVINKKEIYECRVYGINIGYKSAWFTFLCDGVLPGFIGVYFLDNFNKTVFLTKDEAEQALKERG